MPAVNTKALEAVTVIPEDPEPEFVYVTIPDRDLFDFPFSGIGINQQHFGPGRHKVSPEVGKEINERLTIARAADLRVYNNRKDLKTLLEMAKNRAYGYEEPDQRG